ncbi:MAG: HupE/UreJ family protein [Cyanobacteriota bacterium]|nr:HupE/UreJ family protein [Cyanobacteriota bacterium]
MSGIGHPLLGPDHLLFLLDLGSAGLQRPLRRVLQLLAVGLGGSVLSQFTPLPDAAAPWAETLDSLRLAVECLIALSMAPAAWLLPLFGLHGFLLGSTIVGAEPTCLFSYFLGMPVAQGSLLLLVTALS